MKRLRLRQQIYLMDTFFSSPVATFAKKLFLGYLPFSCIGVLLIFAAVAGSSSWGALLAGGVFIAIGCGCFLILQLGLFLFQIDPLRRFLMVAAFTSLLNLFLGVPVFGFLIQTTYRWSLNEQVVNEPVVRCTEFSFRVQSDSEINQARQLMHQFAMDNREHFEDPSPGLSVRAVIQRRSAGNKFVLVSNDVPDKYQLTVLHLGGGVPIRKGIRTDWCNSEKDIDAFNELRQRLSSKWAR